MADSSDLLPGMDPIQPPEYARAPCPPAIHPYGAKGHQILGSVTLRTSLSSIFWGEKEAKPFELDEAKSAKEEEPQPPKQAIGRSKKLLDLPPELLLIIFEHLHFGDIIRIRLTCKTLRALASPGRIRTLFGSPRLTLEMLSHCRLCLKYDSTRNNLLQTVIGDPGYPFSSTCIECALATDDSRLRVGKQLLLGNFSSIWLCLWCGLPIQEEASRADNQRFHDRCSKAYEATVARFAVLGWIQLALGIVAAALSWRYFRHAALVFGPTVTSFLLLWLCLTYLICQYKSPVNYLFVLFLEVSIVGCWVPPLYYLSNVVASSPPNETIPKRTTASLAMFGLNVLFRLLNTLGYIVIACGYDPARRNRPQASWFRKLTHPPICWVMFWAYPPYIYRKRDDG